MILVGAAGVTALDVWITRTRWRIAVPPLDLVRRGGLDEPPDLPIGFLRWWFFSPLQGNLFAAEVTSTDRTWLMRDGAAVIELRLGACRRGELLAATRRLRGRAEQVDECRAGDGSTAIRTGDSVRYVDRASGLRVDLVLESVADATPEEGAFRDPDAPGNDP
jgi:hypothetical protein